MPSVPANKASRRFGDAKFWYQICHDYLRADDLAACYPEHWHDDSNESTPPRYTKDEAIRRADKHLQALRRRPPKKQSFLSGLFCSDPPDVHIRPGLKGRYEPSRLPKTDPIHWIELHGCDRYEAANRALKEYERLLRRAARHTPIDIQFWQCVGLSKRRATDIVRCFPEYWSREGRPWKEAEELTDACRKRLTGALLVPRGQVDKYGGKLLTRPATRESANTLPQWDFDPIVQWLRGSGDTFESAVDLVAGKAGVRLGTHWRRQWQKQRLLETFGSDAALLPDGSIYVGGARLADQETVQKDADLRLQSRMSAGEQVTRVQWGPSVLARRTTMGTHSCAVGMPRTGKTILLLLLMQSREGSRLVVYDAKTDLLSVLRANRPNDVLHILNPVDLRSVAWDIASDATIDQAEDIARILIEDDPREKSYFIEVPRSLLAAAIKALNLAAPAKWEFVDLLGALQIQHIEAVLCRFDVTREVYQTHLARLHHAPNDLPSCLHAVLDRFRPIAAAWMHAATRVSIHKWARSAENLILGNHERYQAGIGPVNRVLLQLIGEALLDRTTRSPQPTSVVLDETEQLGTVELLPALMERGPGLGVSVALGFHDIETLEHYYGRRTRGLIGMCSDYAFLRIGNPVTARWASEVIGSQEVVLIQESQGTVGDERTSGETAVRLERPLVRPTDLQELPLTTRAEGLTGYFRSIETGTYRGTIPGDVLFEEMLKAPAPDFPDFVPRPPEHFIFPPPAEIAQRLARLGFRTLSDTTRLPQPPSDETAGREPFDPNDFPRLDA
jgi:hypothetical protein